ncbi:MAG: hypothetical protein IT285_13305 [Bdellovibrionales bacterium]|nr:hypothetical protein [Bdellovibrionales bacterium]
MLRTGALVLMSLIFGALFWADLAGLFNQAREPVAVLRMADGTVRRLGLNQLTWDRAGGGTLFGAGDTIATGEDGTATLAFYAGGEVLLSEGSMIVLTGSSEELQLQFLSGTGRVRVAKEARKKITLAAAPPPVRKPAAAAPGSEGSVSQATPLPEPVAARVQVEEVEQVYVPPPPVETVREGVAQASPQEAPPVAVTSGTSGAREAQEQAAPEPVALTSSIAEADVSETAQAMASGGELVSVAKLPATPEVVFPSSDAVFDLTTGEVPRLQWKLPEEGSAEAQKDLVFEVVLRPAAAAGEEDPDAEERVIRSKIPSLPLSRVQHGKYLWSVRAVTADGSRSPASASRFMEVIVPAKIAPPKVLPVRVE